MRVQRRRQPKQKQCSNCMRLCCYQHHQLGYSDVKMQDTFYKCLETMQHARKKCLKDIAVINAIGQT